MYIYINPHSYNISSAAGAPRKLGSRFAPGRQQLEESDCSSSSVVLWFMRPQNCHANSLCSTIEVMLISPKIQRKNDMVAVHNGFKATDKAFRLSFKSVFLRNSFTFYKKFCYISYNNLEKKKI